MAMTNFMSASSVRGFVLAALVARAASLPPTLFKSCAKNVMKGEATIFLTLSP
jgi:hypothetical protein